MAKRHHCLNEIDNFLDKKDLQMGGTQLNFASGHLSHAFAIPWLCRKPKKQKPEKTPKPENITEEICEKEAEKIALTGQIRIS